MIAIGGHCYSELGGIGSVHLLLVVHSLFLVTISGVVVAVGF